jgi:hypothetical protein
MLTISQICPNLHFLGKRSTTKTSEGIRIVTLCGRLDDTILAGLSKEQHLPFHTADDAKSLRGANTADILLTTSWPASIRTGSKVPIPEGAVETPSYEHISDLCTSLRPRYHFSSSPSFFYEREPFFHTPTPDAPDVRPITRFISLAAYGKTSKQKSLYAFSLQPTVDPTIPLPSGATASPFMVRANSKKRPALDPEPYPRFSNGNDNTYHRYKRGRRERLPPPGPGECFFCLSNPTVGTHLVASIGDDAYVTTAKGPLTTSSTNAALGLDFPGHMLIIPLTHSPTLALIPEGGGGKTYTEMKRYKTALEAMVADRSSGRLGAVTYDVSRGNGIHTHWQFLPMPDTLIRKGLVEAAFRVEAENMSYPAFHTRDPGLGEEDGDFFRVWIWTSPDEDSTEGITKCLTLSLDNDMRFDLQFGRRVLAKLLGLEKRIQWRDCAQTEEEEKKDVEAFKAMFKDFDFS